MRVSFLDHTIICTNAEITKLLFFFSTRAALNGPGKWINETLLAQTHFFPKVNLHTDYIYHLKALITENSKITSTKSSKKCREIIVKQFFFCPRSWRKFWHFVCLFIFCCRVSRQAKKSAILFWHFWKWHSDFYPIDVWKRFGIICRSSSIGSLNSLFSANNFKWS